MVFLNFCWLQYNYDFFILLALVTMVTILLARDENQIKGYNLINNHTKFEAKRTTHVKTEVMGRSSTTPPPQSRNYICLVKRLDLDNRSSLILMKQTQKRETNQE